MHFLRWLAVFDCLSFRRRNSLSDHGSLRLDRSPSKDTPLVAAPEPMRTKGTVPASQAGAAPVGGVARPLTETTRQFDPARVAGATAPPPQPL